MRDWRREGSGNDAYMERFAGERPEEPFTMRVIHDEWVDDPARSEHNPEGLPERTVLEFELIEG